MLLSLAIKIDLRISFRNDTYYIGSYLGRPFTPVAKLVYDRMLLWAIFQPVSMTLVSSFTIVEHLYDSHWSLHTYLKTNRLLVLK